MGSTGQRDLLGTSGTTCFCSSTSRASGVSRMETKLDGLMNYIKLIANHQRSKDHPNGNLWGYELIEKHGMHFPKVLADLPKGVKYGKWKACYENAFWLANNHPDKYIYVEGCAAGIIPVIHAWCITPELEVVDPTWRGDLFAKDNAYFGIPIDLAWLKTTLINVGTYGILDNFKVIEQLRGTEWMHERWRLKSAG